jgi:UDP-glucose 4-epimerase
MDFSSKRVIVTGGAGFIGSHLVDALAPLCAELVVVDNLATGTLANIEQHLSSPNFTFVEADIRDLEAMRGLVQAGDVIFHLAVECLRVSLFDPLRVHTVNATGTLFVSMAAQEKGAERLIYVSSSEAYGSAERVPMDEAHPFRPTTTYGADKAAGELIAQAMGRTHGLPVIVVRPFNSYGPREHVDGPSGEVIPRFVSRVLQGLPPVIFGDGGQTRDFTWVQDTARGILAAGACDALIGREINIARGEEVSINTIAELVLKATGQTQLQPVYEADRPGDVRRHFADTRLAREVLGFEATTPIAEGVQRYVDWVLAQAAEGAPAAQAAAPEFQVPA